MSLTRDNIVEILLDLPIENFPSTCAISRQYREVCNDERFWRLRLTREFPDYLIDTNLSFKGQYKDNYRRRILYNTLVANYLSPITLPGINSFKRKELILIKLSIPFRIYSTYIYEGEPTNEFFDMTDYVSLTINNDSPNITWIALRYKIGDIENLIIRLGGEFLHRDFEIGEEYESEISTNRIDEFLTELIKLGYQKWDKERFTKQEAYNLVYSGLAYFEQKPNDYPFAEQYFSEFWNSF